jgi:lysophospholipase L1-like esterase
MKTIAVLLALALAPVAVNSHLRNTYRQTLAHWLSKVVPPPTVFIGDSIMTGGMWFDDLRNINVASNGLVTEQIAGNLKLAQAYRPKRIVVMAGMNDAIRGFDPERIRQLWSEMCKEPSLVVTLVPPTKHDEINRKIEQINNIILEACQGMPVIRLNLADDSGRIKPEYASDGVHIGPKGYEKWIAELRR